MEDGFDMDQDTWSQCHPSELAQKLFKSKRHWSVVGVCALELWNGKETSADEELEFCCLSDDTPRFLGILKGLTFSEATKGDPKDTRGDPLPPPRSDPFVKGKIQPAKRSIRFRNRPAVPKPSGKAMASSSNKKGIFPKSLGRRNNSVTFLAHALNNASIKP